MSSCRPLQHTCVYVGSHPSVLDPSLRQAMEAMDPCTLAILARADVIAKPRQYLGFAEWIAWGWDNKVRVMMLLGRNVSWLTMGTRSGGL